MENEQISKKLEKNIKDTNKKVNNKSKIHNENRNTLNYMTNKLFQKNDSFKDALNSTSKTDRNMKIYHFSKITTKLINNKKMKNNDLIGTTRNESVDKTKRDLINKYFNNNNVNKSGINLNNSCVKINSISTTLIHNNSQFSYANI